LKISNKDFVPLHNHSMFSLFDGLSSLEGFVQKSRAMGFPAIALTDHGNVGGWIKLIQTCKATKDKHDKSIEHPPIKPILGMEAYLSADHTFKSNKEQKDARRGNRHINLIAKNFKGYQNICQLSNDAFKEGFFHDPRIDINQLAEHSEGVILGSACLSSVINSNLLHDRYSHAKKSCSIFKDIFDKDFFLEVMYHGIPEEAAIVPDVFKLSSELDIPIVCTNDSHYLEREDAKAQEVLMCMSTSKCIHDERRINFPYEEFYLKSAEEMAEVWGDHPEVLFNSVDIADRVNSVDIESKLFGGMRLPKFDVPDGFDNPFEYLKHLAGDGMKRLNWDKSKKHVKRLGQELEDIKVAYENNNYDFATYFLIVWDYVNYAKEHGILTGPGRGSGYASVLLHCLGIAYGLDPVGEFPMLWERFLAFDDLKYVKESDFGF